jgi:hypothetical protein
LASIAFTAHLQAVGPTRPQACDGATLAEMLDRVAADYPRLKDYVLDDHGRLRQRLAMGSTTGGLWFSEDGGEGWSAAPRSCRWWPR